MQKLRLAELRDLDYLVQAGKEFTTGAGFHFDEAHTRESGRYYITDGIMVVAVDDNDEPTGHCVGLYMPSVYGEGNQIRIVTTWGKGGLKCLRRVMKILKLRGPHDIVVDCEENSTLKKLYKRLGFKLAYEMHIKELR